MSLYLVFIPNKFSNFVIRSESNQIQSFAGFTHDWLNVKFLVIKWVFNFIDIFSTGVAFYKSLHLKSSIQGLVTVYNNLVLLRSKEDVRDSREKDKENLSCSLTTREVRDPRDRNLRDQGVKDNV